MHTLFCCAGWRGNSINVMRIVCAPPAAAMAPSGCTSGTYQRAIVVPASNRTTSAGNTSKHRRQLPCAGFLLNSLLCLSSRNTQGPQGAIGFFTKDAIKLQVVKRGIFARDNGPPPTPPRARNSGVPNAGPQPPKHRRVALSPANACHVFEIKPALMLQTHLASRMPIS